VDDTRDERGAAADGGPPAGTPALEGRVELLALLHAITETRLYRPTGRDGWTVRHLLGAVAAADRTLAHVLGELAEEPTVRQRFRLRRLRGEVMYRAHMRHRQGLAELLAETDAEAEAALSAHGWLLDLPIEVEGSDATSAHDLLTERADSERGATRALRAELPPGVLVPPSR
jgi:hypothetical protein